MGALVKLAQESKQMLVESGVTYLSVGCAVLLDNSAQEKVKSVNAGCGVINNTVC